MVYNEFETVIRQNGHNRFPAVSVTGDLPFTDEIEDLHPNGKQ